jgi:hypothetical protein
MESSLYDDFKHAVEERCRADIENGRSLTFVDVMMWCKQEKIIFQDSEGKILSLEEQRAYMQKLSCDLVEEIRNHYCGGAKAYVAEIPVFERVATEQEEIEEEIISKYEKQLCIDVYHTEDRPLLRCCLY